MITVTQGASVWHYEYDYLNRRIRKYGTGLTEQRFIYDGWNLIAETDGSGNLTRRYAWGLDVSGTLQGAGGVGGLLLIQDGSNSYYPLYDASHNVIGLYNGVGTVDSAYEYDPFGRLQSSVGAYAVANPFRFSTKYTDNETSFAYYGLRYYAPLLGRFINRDPIQEAGGINLYGFCGNDGVNWYDYLGNDVPNIPKDDTIQLAPFTVVAPTDWSNISHYETDNTIRDLNDSLLPKFDDKLGFTLQLSLGDAAAKSQISTIGTAYDITRLRAKSAKQMRSFWRKIMNNIHTLQGIANRLPADQREKLLRQIWGGTTGTTTYTGLLGDFTEGSYRLAKLGLDAAGERALRKSLTSLYKGAASTLKVAGAIGTAVDVTQLFVDIGDRDGLSFVQHSAGLASSLTSKVNPAIGMAVSGFRYMWDDQSSRALDDISMMDKTSIAEANTRQNINIQNGLRNIQAWMGQLQNEP